MKLLLHGKHWYFVFAASKKRHSVAVKCRCDLPQEMGYFDLNDRIGTFAVNAIENGMADDVVGVFPNHAPPYNYYYVHFLHLSKRFADFRIVFRLRFLPGKGWSVLLMEASL